MNCRQIVCSDPVSVDLQHRSATIRAAAAAGDLVALTFSSEAPVERYGGMEILSHAPGAVDLSRLNDGAPLLYCHDPQKVIGIVEKATISGKRGHATIRWGTSALATEVRADVAAGVIRNVSVGYRVIDTEPAGDGAYRVTKWEPLEISLLGLAADQTIGIGRSLTPATPSPMTRTTSTTEAADNGAALATIAEAIGRLTEKVEAVERRAMQPAQPVQRSVPIAGAAPMTPYGVDLSANEQRNYSLVKAIRAAASGDWRDAGLEREVSITMEQELGRPARGFYVPLNAMQTRATYQVGTAAVGGNLVPQELLSGSFVEALRNRAAVTAMGATMLPGLVGNVAIPRRSAVSTAYWVAESQEITESNGGFDQINLTPKTLGCLSNFSRLSSLQTVPEVEQLIRQDFVEVIALGVDAAALRGTGSANQPLGIVNTAGIGTVVGGTDGEAVGFDNLMELIRETAVDNADTPSSGFLINAKTEAALMQIKDLEGTYLIGPATGGSPRALWGREYMVTNQLRSDLVKGASGPVCSELIYGNFADVMIGMWGGLDIVVNPYGAGFKKGDIEIRAMMTVDIGIRQPQSFAVMSDALTP